MVVYILKRIVMLIPILLGVSFLVFAILNIVPGDPARVILGDFATKEAIDQLNEELGFNKPFVERYFMFLKGVITKFDFGTSYKNGQPVLIEVIKRMPVTFKLAFFSIIGSIIVGIPLGVLSAVKQYSLLDNVMRVISIFMSSVPAFWLGMILIFTFSLRLGWLPSSGVANWKGFILPSIALIFPYASQMMRFTRSSMLETIRQDYVKTARAKGVPERQVIFGHAFKNALLPIITVIGNLFGGLLGGAVITESVFSLPGIGSLMVQGIRTKDIPIVVGATFFLAIMFSVIMLLVDLMYSAVDPRIKAKYSK